jgi:hypothetical protein
MNLRQLWRIITKQETPMERGRRAVKGARRYSKWLGERPFGDKHGYGGSDYNDPKYGSPL